MNKFEAYWHCYPMIPHNSDSAIAYQTWEIFSFIWDLAYKTGVQFGYDAVYDSERDMEVQEFLKSN